MWGYFVPGILPGPCLAHIGSRSVCGPQGHSDKPGAINSRPATPAHPMHSLIELRGPVQRLADIRWQVPRVLRGIPGQLLALGVVHIANVVEGSCLPNLWAAARYEGVFYSPPENSPRGTFPGVVQSPGLVPEEGQTPTPSILPQLGGRDGQAHCSVC